MDLTESERKMWRTLLRVTDVDSTKLEVKFVVPGWNSKINIIRSFSYFPKEVIDYLIKNQVYAHPSPILPNTEAKYLHARANIGYDGDDTDNLYFNNFEGGELYYPNQNIIYKPKAGELVIHGSHDECAHGVKPVKSEVRYSYSNSIRKIVKVPIN